jgi:hypothetical protein
VGFEELLDLIRKQKVLLADRAIRVLDEKLATLNLETEPPKVILTQECASIQ